MDIKDLNKSQLILLAILLSFVTSIATGITTVTLMQQAPTSVTLPITKIVRETVDKISPNPTTNTQAGLTDDQKKLLENLRAIKPLTMTLLLKQQSGDKVLGTGLYLGDNKVVISSVIPVPKEGEVYVIQSVLGEQKVSKVTPDKEVTIVELVKAEVPPPQEIPPVVTPDPNATPI